MIGPLPSDPHRNTSRARALGPLYVDAFVGFLGYSLMIRAEALAGVVGGLAAAAFIELPFVVFGVAARLGVSRLWRTGLAGSAAGHRTLQVPGSEPTR